MTGFGAGSASMSGLVASATARSVNHRFLDLLLRVGEEGREFEPTLRTLVGESVKRGRVELRIQISTEAKAQSPVELDLAAVEGVKEALGRLESLGFEAGGVTSGELLALPGVLKQAEAAQLATEECRQLVLDAARAALEELVAMRRTEGEALARILESRLDDLEAITASLRERRPEALAQLHEGLAMRVAELLGEHGLPEDRLAQEVAVLTDKTDVEEELDRLEAHLAHFRETMTQASAIGRRLDFLTQEILRELNTLGSKCRDTAMAVLVIDGKTAVEQLKEQVQNVE